MAEFAPGVQVIAHKKVFTSNGLYVVSKMDKPTRQWYSECPDCKQIRTGQTQVLGYSAAERVCVKTLLSPPGDSPGIRRLLAGPIYPTLKLPTLPKWIGGQLTCTNSTVARSSFGERQRPKRIASVR